MTPAIHYPCFQSKICSSSNCHFSGPFSSVVVCTVPIAFPNGHSNGYSSFCPTVEFLILSFFSCCLDVWGQKVSMAFFAHHCLPIATFATFPTLSHILSLEHFTVFYFAYPAGSYCLNLLLHILKSLHKIGTQH